MVNTKLIRKRLIDKGYTIGEFASLIGNSRVSVGRKMKNKAPLKLDEVDQWCKTLDISRSELLQYFFC